MGLRLHTRPCLHHLGFFFTPFNPVDCRPGSDWRSMLMSELQLHNGEWWFREQGDEPRHDVDGGDDDDDDVWQLNCIDWANPDLTSLSGAEGGNAFCFS